MHNHLHNPLPQATPARTDRSRAFSIGVALNLAFVVIEAAAGIVSNSLALLADAGHNLSDVLGLLLAWGAVLLSRRRPSPRFTYGLRGSSIWAALTNALLLILACGGIAWEALRRFHEPAAVAGTAVMVIAAIGVIINTFTALLFARDRDRDLNARGAFLHMAADAAVSLGVLITGALMLATGWTWLDPAISLAIVAVIFIGTMGLLRESLHLALDAVPAGIDPAAVKARLARMPGVAAVHDLHIWAMSTTETALTAHVVVPAEAPGDDFHAKIDHMLGHEFGIQHVTIQVERGTGEYPCKLAPDDVV